MSMICGVPHRHSAIAGATLALLLLLQPLPARAAEYCGEDIDGQSFDATAFSYSTSHFYNVTVEFDGTDAVIQFTSGGRLRLTLDDEEIEDPDNISAYDYRHAVYWDLDVDGLECDD